MTQCCQMKFSRMEEVLKITHNEWCLSFSKALIWLRGCYCFTYTSACYIWRWNCYSDFSTNWKIYPILGTISCMYCEGRTFLWAGEIITNHSALIEKKLIGKLATQEVYMKHNGPCPWGHDCIERCFTVYYEWRGHKVHMLEVSWGWLMLWVPWGWTTVSGWEKKENKEHSRSSQLSRLMRLPSILHVPAPWWRRLQSLILPSVNT